MSEHRSRPSWLPAEWRGWALALTVISGLLVTFGLVRTVIDANVARDHAIERRSHSFEVIILTRAIGENLAQAEAALGRFVISGDKQLGVRYERDWRAARRQIAALAVRTNDNPLQVRRVQQLQAAYTDRTGELSRIAIFSNHARHAQALSAYYEARDSDALLRIETLMGELMAAERTLLGARSIQLQATVERSNRLMAILLGVGLALLSVGLTFGWGLVEAIAARRAADEEAADERARAAELETAIAAATAQLRAEQAEREAAEAKLQQAHKMEAIGQLTGGIAHDFNNMLAVVLGGLELARRQSDAPGITRHLDLATEGAHRAATLTRQLLAFSRAEPITPEAIDPPHLIAGMTGLLDRTLGDGIRVETRNEGHGWRIWADRHQLENALLNLAVNARDAMDGRGLLTIATGGITLATNAIGACAAGDYATVAVIDSGVGMTPEVQARVFEPFFTTKPVGRGTGLGLSQIFGFVRQSGGEIAIRSTPGQGTTVTLYLPRYQGVADRPKACGAEPAAFTQEGDALDILVVEDDPRVLRATVSALAELGHRPVACGDPLEARDSIAAMPALGLILSDVLMPGQTGPEMVANLRKEWPDVPVLYVTGFAGDIDEGALAGSRVLRKPFTLAALKQAVSATAGG